MNKMETLEDILIFLLSVLGIFLVILLIAFIWTESIFVLKLLFTDMILAILLSVLHKLISE